MKKIHVVLLIFSFIIGFNFVECEKPSLREEEVYSLEKALLYMLENKNDLNLDGYLGVVIALVQLEAATNKRGVEESVRLCEHLLANKDKVIQDESTTGHLHNVAKHILDKKIWDNVGHVRSKVMLCHRRNTTSRVLFTYSPDEQESDMCLSELFPQGGVRGKMNCDASRQCHRIMTRGVAQDYSLTHRVIYYLIKMANGCKHRNETQHLCCDVMREAMNTEAAGFPTETQDLFIEQVLVCGLAGFEEFLKDQWIRRVLEWQRAPGCWGNLENAEEENLYEDVKDPVGNVLEETVRYPALSRRSELLTRKRRSWTSLGPYRCSSHTTGLAVALLGLRLRHSDDSV